VIEDHCPLEGWQVATEGRLAGWKVGKYSQSSILPIFLCGSTAWFFAEMDIQPGKPKAGESNLPGF
jgi:hypothetical protein